MFLPDYAFVLHRPLPHSVDLGQLNKCIRISLEIQPATTFSTYHVHTESGCHAHHTAARIALRNVRFWGR